MTARYSLYSFKSSSKHLLRKSLLNSLPIDNVPDGLEILSLAVLILQTDLVSGYGKAR